MAFLQPTISKKEDKLKNTSRTALGFLTGGIGGFAGKSTKDGGGGGKDGAGALLGQVGGGLLNNKVSEPDSGAMGRRLEQSKQNPSVVAAEAAKALESRPDLIKSAGPAITRLQMQTEPKKKRDLSRFLGVGEGF